MNGIFEWELKGNSLFLYAEGICEWELGVIPNFVCNDILRMILSRVGTWTPRMLDTPCLFGRRARGALESVPELKHEHIRFYPGSGHVAA